MKKISQKDIESVLNLIYRLNCGVQEFEAVQKLFTNLPLIEEAKTEANEQ